MKIFLVELPKHTSSWEYDASSQENLGIEYLAAEARLAGHEVFLASCPAYKWSLEDLKEVLRPFAPDVLGISLPFSDGLTKALVILPELRELVGPTVHITVGGRGATASSKEILQNFPEVDSIIYGEGDITFLNLLGHLSKQIDWQSIPGVAFRTEQRVCVNKRHPLIDNLDLLPFPARDIFLRSKDHGEPPIELYISGSRGCPYRCSFCDIGVFYGEGKAITWRGRSPSNIVDELEILVKECGAAISYCFVDDNFMGVGKAGQERAKEIARELIRRKLKIDFEISCRTDSVNRETMQLLKRAGLRSVYLGMESSVERALNTFQKGTSPKTNEEAIKVLSALDISCDIGFIMFDPWNSLDEISTNIQFLRHISSTYNVLLHPSIIFSSLCFYPGAEITSRYNTESTIDKDLDSGDSTTSSNYTYFIVDKRVGMVKALMESLWEDTFRNFWDNNMRKMEICETEGNMKGVSTENTYLAGKEISEVLLDVEDKLILELKSNHKGPNLSLQVFEELFSVLYSQHCESHRDNFQRRLKKGA